jgi:cytochrome P450
MRHCMYEICRRPDVYKRVQAEVDQYYRQHQLSKGITYKQIQDLPYLTAVCKESMRMSPSIPAQLPRLTPPGGLQVGAYFLPEGTEVGINPITQNRDEEIWGLDADQFRPERWLEEEKSKWLDSQDFTFGGNGPRMCIGRNIALVSIWRLPI